MKRFTQRRVGIGAVALMVTASLAACGSGDGGDSAEGLEGEVGIGVHWCLTGEAAYAGKELVKGSDLAVETINEEGFLGDATIKAYNEDDASDNAQSVSITQKLINQNKVSGIVGGCLSGATLAAVPIADEAGVPWVVGNAVAPGIAAEGDYIFRTSMPYTPIFKQMVDEVMPALGAKKAAIIFGSDNPSQVSFADDFRKFLEEGGYDIVLDEGITSADTDFSALITKVKSSDPDVLLPMLLGPQAANFVLQASNAGIDLPILGQQGHNVPDLYEIAGEAAVGWIVPSTWFLDVANDENSEFVKLYREKYNEEPGLYAANGYTSMYVMAKAIKAAGSSDRDAIQQALSEMKEIEVPLGDGTMTFDEEGEGSQTGVILQLGSNGEFELWKP